MKTEPSPLALKLCELFQREKSKVTAESIDNVILWDGLDKCDKIREANKRLSQHCDNILVKGGKDSHEFLAISCRPDEGDDRPFRVWFYRYCLPGRCDRYSFKLTVPTQHTSGGHVTFCQDYGSHGLAGAIQDAAKDFDKPQVVGMIQNALNADRILSRYGREIETLLSQIAPKSKSYRLTRKMVKALENKRQKAFAERQAARQALRDKGVTDEEIEKALGPVKPILS
jgi:hypothetical protein